MVIGTLALTLRLDGCRSLKDKRQILRSLLDKSRRQFHVAIAEVCEHDLWQNATIGVSCVSTNAGHAESVLQHVVDLFDACPDVAVEEAIKEIERR